MKLGEGNSLAAIWLLTTILTLISEGVRCSVFIFISCSIKKTFMRKSRSCSFTKTEKCIQLYLYCVRCRFAVNEGIRKKPAANDQWLKSLENYWFQRTLCLGPLHVIAECGKAQRAQLGLEPQSPGLQPGTATLTSWTRGQGVWSIWVLWQAH